MKAKLLIVLVFFICHVTFGQKVDHRGEVSVRLLTAHSKIGKIAIQLRKPGDHVQPPLLPTLLRNVHELVREAQVKIDHGLINANLLNEINVTLEGAAATLEKLKFKNRRNFIRNQGHEETVKLKHANGSFYIYSLTLTSEVITDLEELSKYLKSLVVSYKELDSIEEEMESIEQELTKHVLKKDNDSCTRIIQLLDLFDIQFRKYNLIASEKNIPVGKIVRKMFNNIHVISRVCHQSQSIENYIGNVLTDQASAASTSKAIETGLAQQFGESPFSIKITMRCADEVCNGAVYKMEINPVHGPLGPIAQEQTWDLGKYKTDASIEAVHLFMQHLIKRLLWEKGLHPKDINLRLFGSTDKTSIYNHIKYDSDCGSILNCPFKDATLEKESTVTIRNNKIKTNTQLAFVRAFCLQQAILAELAAAPGQMEIHTKVFTLKDRKYRRAVVEVIIPDLNAQEVDQLTEEAKSRLAREIKARKLYP